MKVKAVLFSAGLFSFFTIPSTGIINTLAKGRAISEQIGNVHLPYSFRVRWYWAL